MPFNQPVPTYAPVSETSEDPKTGKKKDQFNPAWLSWFLSLTKEIGIVDLTSGVSGVLATANGGTGEDISAANFTGTVVLAKLTGVGTDGSLDVVNGFIQSATPPT